ncbi:MAG: pyridoxamine 5'-phosphate oxidase family protein [Candidatus Bathyarchaeota archaeon]|nr:pyridoxamine 5'-phosphate oxidase family protein [Candidatus Bathyarchaeota archaeon]
MSKQEIWELIKNQKLCRIIFKGDPYPHIAPFQYVVMDGVLYFHFADYGKKMKLLKEDNRVCVEIEQYAEDLSEYQFVVLQGSLKVVTDSNERAKALQKIANEGKQKLSSNFLAAHGFNKEDGWDSLTEKSDSLVVVKLLQVTKEVGLKSP